MAGKTLDLMSIISEDQLAVYISNTFTSWDNARVGKKAEWKEVRNYLFATDTSTTTNASLPWKNKTTTPKLTQIRDNLFANYMTTIFPKRRWMIWEGASKDDETRMKKEVIESYMYWITTHPKFKSEIKKVLLDYIDYGNCFATIEWVDERQETKDKLKTGFVGPLPKRISPYDIVFNPLADSFENSPKIIRSMTSIGELKTYIDSMSPNSEEAVVAKSVYDYIRELRTQVQSFAGNVQDKNVQYQIDGFSSYTSYLQSDSVELLTYYGDIYDMESQELKKNMKIVVVDRHKVLYNKPDQSFFGRPQVYHAGWRVRQDNLWAMGPLDNLVGLQYRVDHLENLKADCFDLIAFPPLKIKGYVENFTWGPFEKIFVSEEGDVEVMSPDVQALNANTEIEQLMAKMEELAGAPKEAMGFRTPGEKTMYEVQRLENAASRIFQNKSVQFEEEFLERLLNGMLELARRMGDTAVVRRIEPQFGAVMFDNISADDLIGIGSIRPVAARHFSESAELVQNLSNFFQSSVGQDPMVRNHFSSIGLARLMEEILEIKDYKIVEENVRVAEEADAQRQVQSLQEDLHVEAQTDPGVTGGGPGMEQALKQLQAAKSQKGGTPSTGPQMPAGGMM